jgi:CheY-like chemotaxis protein
MLWVSDTGHGMEKDVLDHVFEPFYTTKDVGKGTGLGLSTVYGIVKSYHGHITCESERGRGTTFKVYFPASGKEKQGLHEKRGEDTLAMHGRETILLVDDEATIREYCGELLKGYGYTVLTARSGEEALELFVREKGRINLVISDLIMPGMGGKRCLEEVLKLDRGVKVLMMTGYAVSDHIGDALEAGAKGVLNKPFSGQEMATMIRSILDEEPIPRKTTSAKRNTPELRVVVSK